jgi:hypothetical protein
MWGAALTQNVDFNCNKDICFGIGPVHDKYKLFQQTLNRFAPLGKGFKPLDVDGFIGDLTVAAANAAAEVATLPSPGLTHEAVAASVDDFTSQLSSIIDMLVTAGVIAPINDAERAKIAATDTDLTKPPPAAATAIVGTSTPSPEIDGVIQQTVAACRASRSSPACTRAKTMCKSIRGTPQASLAEVKEICDSTSTPLWVFLLAGGLGVGAIIGIGVLHARRRRAAEAVALGNDARPARRYKRVR